MSGRAAKLARQIKAKAAALIGHAPEVVNPDPAASPRYVSFESLLKTGRAVKVRTGNRGGEYLHFVVAHLAGEQGEDGHSKVYSVGYSDGKSAKRVAERLLAVVREGVRDGYIRTDHSYNHVLTVWAQSIKSKIEMSNIELTASAEEKAKAMAPVDALIDMRGVALRDWLRGVFGLERIKVAQEEMRETKTKRNTKED